jgi:hypothetical protein
MTPTTQLGLGVETQRGVLLELQVQGPAVTTVRGAAGSARIRSTAVAVGAGSSWQTGRRAEAALLLQGGLRRYRIEGQGAPGFIGDHLERTALALGADARLTFRFASWVGLVGGLGARLSLPAIRVQVGGDNLAEQGRLDLQAGLAVVVFPGVW